MISALGLLCLVLQMRYGRVVDIVMKLNSEKRDLRRKLMRASTAREEDQDIKFIEERLKTIEDQLDILLKRGLVIKRSLYAMFSAVLCFILTSFLIWVSLTLVTPIEISAIALITFYVGMLLTIVALALLLKDVFMSYTAALLEIKRSS